MADPQQFKDKVSIVTGAASGIGLAASRLMLERGAKVMMVDNNADQLEASVANIGSPHAQHLVADVADPEQVENYAVLTEQHFGGIDLFFSNAGIEGGNHRLLDYPLATFDQVMNVNTRAALIGLQAVVPKMNKGGAVLLNASVAAEYGSPGLVAYHASKHAILGIMRTAALEFAELGIRINAINPGAVNTGMFERITTQSGLGAEDYANAIKAMVPLGRYSLPEEIAELALFLLSDAASYCHGRAFGVDGGITAST